MVLSPCQRLGKTDTGAGGFPNKGCLEIDCDTGLCRNPSAVSQQAIRHIHHGLRLHRERSGNGRDWTLEQIRLRPFLAGFEKSKPMG